MRWLPPLTAIRAFEAVGRHGVAAAASKLNVTPAAIYHQVRTLEAELGVRLFTRSKQGLVLTLKGEQYLAQVGQTLDTLNECSRAIRADTFGNRLVIDSLTSFATDFLVPRLSRFRSAYPDISVEFLTLKNSGGRVRFEKTGAHVAIRGGGAAGHWPGLRAERLVHETFFPVCTPALMEGPHPLRRPADLAHHTILNVTSTPEGWRDWLDAAAEQGEDIGGVDLDGSIRFDLIHMSMMAAVKGVGVDLARAPLVDHWMEAGALVAPFGLKLTSTLSYWLICPEPFSQTPQFKAFRAWIFDELRASRYVQEEEEFPV
jgi:LysR family glycine cleavage system transcriptional activator